VNEVSVIPQIFTLYPETSAALSAEPVVTVTVFPDRLMLLIVFDVVTAESFESIHKGRAEML
jgi:hypothetical protein